MYELSFPVVEKKKKSECQKKVLKNNNSKELATLK